MANLSLRGHTYDARHLDKFLDSEFGDRSISPERVAYSKSTLEKGAAADEDLAHKHKRLTEHLPSHITSPSAIKPTTSFLNLGRDKQVFDHYIDLMSGPSSLQKRHSIPTQYEVNKTSIYETQREEHQSKVAEKVSGMMEARKSLFGDQTPNEGLCSAKTTRDDIKSLREKMDSYLAFKQEHKLLTKRDRLMRTAWKHGIVGVDDADSATTSIFYLEAEK